MERSRFAAYLEAFEQQLRAEGKSANTLTSYTRDTREFLGYLADVPESDIDEITEDHIAGFLASLRGRELAERSKAKKLTSIRSFLLFCRREGLLRAYPPKLTYAKIKPRVARLLARGGPAAAGNLEGRLRNTRRYIRVLFGRPVRVRPAGRSEAPWIEGDAHVLGRGGMGLTAHWMPVYGTAVEAAFTLEDGDDELIAVGRVVHVVPTSDGATRIGLEFQNLPTDVSRPLTAWIAAKMGRAAGNGHAFTGENTRRFVRVPLGAGARFRVFGNGADFHEGEALDLGAAGVAIRSHFLLPENARDIEVIFPIGEHEVTVRGRVANRLTATNGDGRPAVRLGIEFTDLSPDATAQISGFLSSRLAA